MSIETRWEAIPGQSDKKIVIFDYIGKWTWAQFHTLHAEIIKQIESEEIKIYPIVNIGKNTYLPPSALTNLRRDKLMTHPRVIQVSMVIDNPFIRTIANITTRLVGFENPPKTYTKLEDAEAWIAGDVATASVS